MGGSKVFYSREWVFSKMTQIMDQRTPSKVQASNICGILLVGETGAGKTTVCAQLVCPTVDSGRQRALARRVLAHHFIDRYQPESQSVTHFIRRIVHQLSTSPLLKGYAEKLCDAEVEGSLEAERIERDPDEAFQRAVLFPLLEMDTPSENVLLVVDSLDEPVASVTEDLMTKRRVFMDDIDASDVSQSIAELLANHYHLLPPWIIPVLTLRRSNKSLARLFTGFKKMALDQVRRGCVVRDVQQYILGRLERESSLRRHLTRETAPALNMLHIKSHGCLLYVETLLDGVSDGSVLLRDIPEIPGTLNGLYLWLCQRLFTRRSWNKVQPILAVLLAARQPPTQDDLFRTCLTAEPQLTRHDFRKRMQLLRKLLTTSSSSTCTIFHSSFAEWLSDVKHCTQRFLVNVGDGHARWAIMLAAKGQDISTDELHDLTFHLSRFNVQHPLEAWHLPLWLLWTKTPLPDQAAIQVMVTSLGAQLSPDADLTSPLQNWTGDEQLQQPGQDESLTTHHIIFDSCGATAETDDSEDVTRIAQFTTDTAPIPAVPEVFPENVSEVIQKATECHDDCDTTGASPKPHQDKEEKDEDQESGNAILESASHPEEDSLQLVERRNSVRYRLREHSLNDSEDPEQTLFYATQMGFSSTVQKLCSRYRPFLSPASLRHALSIAARQGHASLVSILLEAGADPDIADSEGWTPLRASAWGGHASAVQVLLERGAQVDASDIEGRTALRAAAWAGHELVVSSLLKCGANVDGEDRQGRTPLIAAAYMGHADIVAALLDAGAVPDHVDCEGRTALSVAVLSVACRNSQQSGVPSRKRPIRRKPRKNVSEEDPEEVAEEEVAGGESEASNAVECEDNEAVETVAILLEYGASVNHQDKEGMTPLLVAAFEGHRSVCELLLEWDADVDQADLGGRTPLLAAASMGHSEIVELLLFWGCYVDSIDAEGRTVLSVASAQGSVEVVGRLLDRGLDEAHRDNAGWTPLHYAAFEGHPAVIDLLLEVGSRSDATDNDGRTALLLAAQEGHTKVVERLIEVGANVNHKSLDGKNALRAAAIEGHDDIVVMLIRAHADISCKDPDGRSTIYLLVIENKITQVETILKEAGKCNLENDRDLEGRSPLHIAAWQGNASMVELLIRHGADVNAVDREQRTPLQSAAWQGHESVVWLLLKHGASGDQPCSQGATPLSIAAQEGHDGVAKLLLASGADPNRADRCGRTALKLALKGGHKKVIHLLENWPLTLNGSRFSVDTSAETRSLSSNNADPRDSSPALHLETGLRSSTSSGKSSSFTSSTARSSQLSVDPNAPAPPVPSPPTSPLPSLSFTQQLQQQAGRSSRNRTTQLPLFPRILSPLSEPQSPLYSSPPPPTPPNDEDCSFEPIWQRLDSSLSTKETLQSNGLSDSHCHSTRLNLLRHPERVTDDGINPLPVPQRTSSVDPDRTITVNVTDKLSSRPSSVSSANTNPSILTKSSHMQIILGAPSKSRRNGFGLRPHSQLNGSSQSNGGWSGMLAGFRNSALMHGSNKLKNALCNAVTRPGVIPIKKETQL